MGEQGAPSVQQCMRLTETEHHVYIWSFCGEENMVIQLGKLEDGNLAFQNSVINRDLQGEVDEQGYGPDKDFDEVIVTQDENNPQRFRLDGAPFLQFWCEFELQEDDNENDGLIEITEELQHFRL